MWVHAGDKDRRAGSCAWQLGKGTGVGDTLSLGARKAAELGEAVSRAGPSCADVTYTPPRPHSQTLSPGTPIQ